MPIELQQSGYIGSITYRGQNVNILGERFGDVVGERQAERSHSFGDPDKIADISAEDGVHNELSNTHLNTHLPDSSSGAGIADSEVSLNHSVSDSWGNVKQYSISEPEEAGHHEYSAEELAEIEALRNRADMELDGKKERPTWTVVEPDSLKGTVLRHYEQALKKTVAGIAKSLNVPQVAKRDYLMPIAQELGKEYLEKGTISAEVRDRLFERAWKEGRTKEREFYDTYKEVKDHLRTTAVTLGEADRDSRDWKDFQKRAFGTLKLKNEGGLPVDTAWGELREMAPALFPEDIWNPADQLAHMLEVGQSIKPKEQTWEEYYGPDAAYMKKVERMDGSSPHAWG